MKKKLTDKVINQHKPSEGRLEIFDSVVPGFGLRISSSDARSYFVLYRVKGSPKLRRHTIGRVGVKDLSEARDEARDWIKDGQRGIDRTEQIKAVVIAQVRDNFKTVATDFIERYAKKHQRNWQVTEKIIEQKLTKRWETKSIQEITRRDVLDLLDGIMDRGAPYMANRTLATARKLFNWAVERDVLTASPVAGIKAPGKEKGRDRVLNDDEIKMLWAACSGAGYPFGSYVQMLLLTGQRKTELISMCKGHVQGGIWHIPQTKNDQPHAIPLSPAALAILESLPTFDGDYLFTCTGGEKPIGGFSKFKTALDKRAEFSDWRLHDLRRTAASGMARQGVAPHIIERILNHRSGEISGVAAVYNRYGYETEMRAALDKWAVFLQHIIEPSDNVVPMVKP